MFDHARRYAFRWVLLITLAVTAGLPSSFAGTTTIASTSTAPASFVTDVIPAFIPAPGVPGLMRNPAKLTAAGSLFYFTAGTYDTGEELWKSDGTEAGTGPVRDIFPGTGESKPEFLTYINGTLFFAADDGAIGRELWKSDGTPAGTMPVRDIFPGPGSGDPHSLINIDGILFFTANNGVNGRELWKSDGTEAGTTLVRDLRPGSDSTFSLPWVMPGMLNVNGTLFFNAATNDHGMELWKSDGSEAGTVRVSNIAPDAFFSGISARSLSNLNGTVIFVANDGVSGYELWRSDGTEAGTTRIRDINPGASSSYDVALGSDPVSLTVVNNHVFFVPDDGVSGYEVWRSDGTEAGTVRVSDINPGPIGSWPMQLTKAGDLLFFLARDASNVYGLWRSDGSEAGTFEIRAEVNTFDTKLVAFNGILFFTDDDVPGSFKRWRTDGTIANTTLAGNVCLGDGIPNANGILMCISTEDSGASKIWRSDGTEAGTVLITRIAPLRRIPYPANLATIGSTIYFARDDGMSGLELWKSDGTPAGTSRVLDINPGPGSGLTRPSIGVPPAPYLVAIGTTLFFPADDGVSGVELWKSDGTPSGTMRVRDINPGAGDALPRSNQFSPMVGPQLVNVNGTLFFTADDGVSGIELWKSDGSESGTVRVRDIRPGPIRAFETCRDGGANAAGWTDSLTNVNGTLFFIADDGVSGCELWKSDGSEEGTVLVRDIVPGNGSAFTPSPYVYTPGVPLPSLTAVGSILFFIAHDGSNDFELWKSDGTAAGTLRVRDINPGIAASMSSIAPSLTNVGGTLFFVADDGTSGVELWKSDGTEAGTVRVRDIFPSHYSAFSASFAPSLTNVGGTLFFSANDGTNGYELWKSDGTEAGTVRVKDIAPGLASSAPARLANAGGTLVFAASDPQLGMEWWRSDGSANGTALVQNIAPGITNANPSQFTIAGDRLFFLAYTERAAVELWLTPLADISRYTSAAIPATGGGIASSDGAIQVAFPPGAAPTGAIAALVAAIDAPPPPEGYALALPFRVTVTSASGEPVTQFDPPLTLTITYREADLAGLDETKLNLAFWNGSTWQSLLPCAGCSVDTANNRVTVVLDHLTEFALLVDTQQRVYLPLVVR